MGERLLVIALAVVFMGAILWVNAVAEARRARIRELRSEIDKCAELIERYKAQTGKEEGQDG